MKDSYSFVAPFYSSLVRLIFGYKVLAAKTVFAQNLDQKRILIIGGGDGLDYLGFASDLRGEYWELSAAMLRKAKRNLGDSKMSFHLGEFQSDSKNKFDEVWLHFVLDTMLDTELEKLLSEIKKSLTPTGKVFFSDFFEPKVFTYQMIHKAMIIFFRLMTGHKRKDLPDYEFIFEKAGFRKMEERTWYSNWIKAQLWQC